MENKADGLILLKIFSDATVSEIKEYKFEIHRSEEDKDIDSMDKELIKYIESKELLKDTDIYSHISQDLKTIPEYPCTKKFDIYIRYFNFHKCRCLCAKMMSVVKDENGELLIE